MELPTKVRRAPAVGLRVSELIERLRLLNPESVVVVEGRYGGLDSIKALVPLDIMLNVNGDPDFGPHERAESEDAADVRAVALISGTVGAG
jgi:hypothetical protein